MGGENDWDLYAIVRSCNSSSSSISNPVEDALSSLASLSFNEKHDTDAFLFSDIFQNEYSNESQDLQKAYMSFLPNDPVVSSPIPATSNNPSVSLQNHHFSPPLESGISISASPVVQEQPLPTPPHPLIPKAQRHYHPPPPPLASFRPDFPCLPITQSITPRSRKRKNIQKRTIRQVTAENLSTDMWAWRKYGQKPIKGSPYPRNYYRCSSSKGCGARKQVERNNADPETFLITYTGDHSHPRPTHRSSLAGSSRNKLISKNPMSGDPDLSSTSVSAVPCSCSSPSSPISPVISLIKDDGGVDENSNDVTEEMAVESGNDDDDDDEDDILIPNLAMRDEIFVGLEEFVCSPKRRS